jgi:hypothetical protein
MTYPLPSAYEIKELPTGGVLKDHENITWGVNKFEVLYDVGVVEEPQNFNFSLHFFEYTLLLNSFFVQYLYCYLVSCDFVKSHYRKVMGFKLIFYV